MKYWISLIIRFASVFYGLYGHSLLYTSRLRQSFQGISTIFYDLVTILKKQLTLKWRWRTYVDAALVFNLNIDNRSQFQEKQKVFEEREEYQ